MKEKKFYNIAGGFSEFDMSDDSEEYRTSQVVDDEDLTAEKVFFSGLNKKLPVEEHSTLLKMTKVSLVKNSI